MSRPLQEFPAPKDLTEVAGLLGMLTGALTTVETPVLQPWGPEDQEEGR